MKKNINICYCINSPFLQLTLKSIDHIRKFFRSNKYNLQFFIISDEPIADVPDNIKLIQHNPRIPVSLVQLRSHIPKILDVDKLIYLDADTTVSTCISHLWEMNINENIVGAVQHCYFETVEDAFRFYSFPDRLYNKNPYFNSGVLLIDCIKWNEQNITDNVDEAFQLYKSTDQWKNDEPGLNIALCNKWEHLHDSWNYCPRNSYKRAYITHYYGIDFDKKPKHNMFNNK